MAIVLIPSPPHRVAAAALRGDISAYIILSPTVYGKGLGLGNSEHILYLNTSTHS